MHLGNLSIPFDELCFELRHISWKITVEIVALHTKNSRPDSGGCGLPRHITGSQDMDQRMTETNQVMTVGPPRIHQSPKAPMTFWDDTEAVKPTWSAVTVTFFLQFSQTGRQFLTLQVQA